MAWSKNIFYPDIFLKRCIIIICKKCRIRQILIKMEGLPPFCGVVFVFRPAESRPIGLRRGWGALTGSHPCFQLVAWESFMTLSCTAMHFFIAIQIRVKQCFFKQSIPLTGKSTAAKRNGHEKIALWSLSEEGAHTSTVSAGLLGHNDMSHLLAWRTCVAKCYNWSPCPPGTACL